eukprot:PhM_4_TR10407/c0_g1_i1/m.21641
MPPINHKKKKKKTREPERQQARQEEHDAKAQALERHRRTLDFASDPERRRRIVFILHPYGAPEPRILHVAVPESADAVATERFSFPVPPPLDPNFPDILNVRGIYYCERDIIGLCGALTFTPAGENGKTHTFQVGPILPSVQNRNFTVQLPSTSCKTVTGTFEGCITPYPPGCQTGNEAVFLSQIVEHMRDGDNHGSHALAVIQGVAKALPLYDAVIDLYYDKSFPKFIAQHCEAVFRRVVYTAEQIEGHGVENMQAGEPRIVLTEDADVYLQVDLERDRVRVEREREMFKHVERILRESGAIDASVLMDRLLKECPSYAQLLYPSITVFMRVLTQNSEMFATRDDDVQGTIVSLRRAGVERVLREADETARRHGNDDTNTREEEGRGSQGSPGRGGKESRQQNDDDEARSASEGRPQELIVPPAPVPHAKRKKVAGKKQATHQ